MQGPGFTEPEAAEVSGGFFDWLADHWGIQFAALADGQGIRVDSDPKALARAVIAMLDGLFLHLTLFDPGPEIAAARCEVALTVIASGLRS